MVAGLGGPWSRSWPLMNLGLSTSCTDTVLYVSMSQLELMKLKVPSAGHLHHRVCYFCCVGASTSVVTGAAGGIENIQKHFGWF